MDSSIFQGTVYLLRPHSFFHHPRRIKYIRNIIYYFGSGSHHTSILLHPVFIMPPFHDQLRVRSSRITHPLQHLLPLLVQHEIGFGHGEAFL